jgi:maltose/moltooligosaccharide transporter
MEKRRLSFWEIWNMSFGFLGIQFGFALQNANVSRIFETLGANADELPILWLAAPVTGLIVQPIIGYFSDRTWNRLGRRRPYFLAGAILASLSLILMPNSPMLWIAAGTLWMLDASINISMEPFRAFVGDILPEEQRTRGFAMQSFFIGTGAVVASMLPYIFKNWIGIVDDPNSTGVPDSVKWSFYLGSIAFIGTVLWTIFRTKEYPPKDLEALRADKTGMFSGIIESFKGIAGMPKTMKQLAWVQFFSWFALFSMWIYTTTSVTSTVYDMTVTKAQFTEIDMQANAIYNDEIKQKATAYNAVSFSEKLNSFFVPDTQRSRVMRIESMGGAIAGIKSKGEGDTYLLSKSVIDFFRDKDYSQPLSAATKARLDYAHNQYETGADWVGVCFAIYNGVAAIFAIFLPLFVRKFGMKATHLICLVAGGIGLISIFFIRNDWYLVFSMIGVGIAWSSILSIPYAILSGSLPEEKMGYYMGVFNFFIVIPQIISAGILGFILNSVFDGEPIYALIVGGCMMIVAGLLTLRVSDNAKITINQKI